MEAIEINLMPLTQAQAKMLASKNGTKIRLHFEILKSHKKKAKGKMVTVIDRVKARAIEFALEEDEDKGGI